MWFWRFFGCKTWILNEKHLPKTGYKLDNMVTGLPDGRNLRLRLCFSLISVFGRCSAGRSLPCGGTASQEGPTAFDHFQYKDSLQVFVEAKTHSLIKGLVISYQNVNLSQLKPPLFLPDLAQCVGGGGPLFPSILPTSLLLPAITPLLGAPPGCTQGEVTSGEGVRNVFYISSHCSHSLLAVKVICVRQAVPRGCFHGAHL